MLKKAVEFVRGWSYLYGAAHLHVFACIYSSCTNLKKFVEFSNIFAQKFQAMLHTLVKFESYQIFCWQSE